MTATEADEVRERILEVQLGLALSTLGDVVANTHDVSALTRDQWVRSAANTHAKCRARILSIDPGWHFGT